MKKCIMIVLLITLMMVSSNVAFSDFSTYLENHWAKDIVDKQFVEKYFSYLAEEDYSNFEPDGGITVGLFKTSLENLINTYSLANGNKDVAFPINKEETEVEDNEAILRKDAIKVLADIFDGEYEHIDLPFSDISELSEEYKDAISKVYTLGIIKGHSNQNFSPEEPVSQVQAIILLERLEKIMIENIKDIPFEIVNAENVYEGKEGIKIEDSDDKVIITITRQFSNPGYNMEVTNVKKLLNEKYKIYTKITNPDPNKMYAQVITYKSVVIKISKEFLENEYQFETDFPTDTFTKSKEL